MDPTKGDHVPELALLDDIDFSGFD